MLAVGGQTDVISPQGQEALEQIADRFLIVHHQNEIPIARGGRGRLRGFRGRRGFSGRGRVGRLWERPLYRLHQDLQREPLAQKILDAQLPGLFLQRIRPPRRQDHHGGLRIDRAQLLKHLDAVHLRHSEVQQRKAGAVLLEQLEALATVQGRDNFVAVTAEHRPQQIADQPLIVHY